MRNFNLEKIKYIKLYTNCYENRFVIYKEFNNKCGIYCWHNTINNKIYVGSANNLRNRFYKYFSSSHMNALLLESNSHIYKALLKYGYNNFQLIILEICDKNILIEKEQYYIDLHKPQYNILKVAGSPLGSKHTIETINKLKNYKPSLEALTKLRLAKNLAGNIIITIDKTNNKIVKYNSVREAARNLNVSHAGLEYCMDNNILLKNTYLIIKLLRIRSLF